MLKMIKVVKYIILLLLMINTFGVYSQKNTSFVHTNLFSGGNEVIRAVVHTTTDNSIVYLETFRHCTIDSTFTKFITSIHVQDKSCCEREKYLPENKMYDAEGRSLLVKVNNKGNIEWAKCKFTDDFSCKYGEVKVDEGVLKQTKDNGFIASINGRIEKYDENGNTTWKLHFDRDSIPNISKTEFLRGAQITDIYQCLDGSYIALLNAGFSLLKISKSGKPLWLKSTLFKEFNPMVFEYFENQQIIDKADSIHLNYSQWNRGGGIR